MLYATISARWRGSPIQLPDEPSDNTLNDPAESPKMKPLTGWRVLLLWLPALCDLTRTTVRAFVDLPLSCSHLCDWGSVAHERWLAVYPRVDLSNDPWCAGAVRWDPFRGILAPQTVYLPVSDVSPGTTLSIR